MAIKLRVISDHYQELGEQRSRVFGVNGCTIGRAPDNDWILPDGKRLVSGHHCDIEYRGGGYWLVDKSTNGVYVNESEDPVSESGPVALQDGDRLRLGQRLALRPRWRRLPRRRRHLVGHGVVDRRLFELVLQPEHLVQIEQQQHQCPRPLGRPVPSLPA